MPNSKDSSAQIAIVVVGLLVVVGGAWVFLNSKDAPLVEDYTIATKSVVVDQRRDASATTQEMPVDTALQMAEMAFQAGLLVGEDDDTAMHFYGVVLDQEPDNSRAKSGMNLIATQLNDEVESLLGKEKFKEAVERIAFLDQIEPDSERVLALRDILTEKSVVLFASLNAAISNNEFELAEELVSSLQQLPDADQGRVNASLVTIASKRKEIELDAIERAAELEAALAAEKLNAAVAQTKESLNQAIVEQTPEPVVAEVVEELPVEEDLITPLLTKAKARVTQNRLFKPAGNSAVDFYKQVLELEDDNPEAKLGLRSLVQKMASDAYAAAERSDWEDAEEALTFAETADIAEDLVAQTRKEISALKVIEATNKVVAIDTFEVESTVPPKYPNRAIARSIEGWVKVEFTVSESGDTQDLEVVESSERLAKAFSKSALAAVEQWRFKPRSIDGQVVAQRSQTTVQFKLAD